MKKLINYVALLLLVVLTACEGEKNEPVKTTPLDKPVLTVEEVTEDGFTIAWTAVPNAVKYTLAWGQGQMASQTETSRTFTEMAPGTYTIEVKANAPEGSKEYADSDYATIDVTVDEPLPPLEFEFEVGLKTATAAQVTVTPSRLDETYYVGIMSLEEFDEYSSRELTEMITAYVAEQGASVLTTGEAQLLPYALPYKTEFVVYAMGMTEEGESTTKVKHAEFATTAFTPEISGNYYGDLNTPEMGQFEIIFTDKGWDEEGNEKPKATYYHLDVYAPMLISFRTIMLPSGTYTLDADNTFAENTISMANSYYWATDANGEVIGEPLPFEDATLTVLMDSYNGNFMIEAQLTINGQVHEFSYEKKYRLKDKSPKEILTTLTSDVEADMAGCWIESSSHADFWKTGYWNWMIFMLPAEGHHDYFTFDLLTAYSDAESGFLGTYVGSSELVKASFISGFMDAGYPAGSWYYKQVNGENVEQAPLMTGEFTISYNQDGTHTFVLDAWDDAEEPNHITLNFTGYIEGVNPLGM